MAYSFTEEHIHEIQGNTLVTKGTGWFHRDGDRLKFSATYTEDPGKVGHLVEVFTSDKLIRYSWMQPEKGPDRGSLHQALRMQDFAARCGWLDGYDTIIRPLKRVAAALQDYQDLRVAGKEMIGETLCQVVAAKTPYGEFTLWLAEGSGCLPLKWTHKVSPKDRSGYHGKLYEEADKDLLGIDITVDCVVVRLIDQVFFPVGGQETVVTRSSKYGEIKDRCKTTREKVQLNPSFSDEDFSIDLPDGAQVVDNDKSGIDYEYRGGTIVPARAD